MKKMMTMMAVALMAITTKADITYAPSALGVLNDASGNPMDNGTYVLVLDRDNDGWNGLSYLNQAALPADNSASWLWDADDFIMARGAIGSVKGENLEWAGDAFPFWTVTTANIPAGYTAGGDNYYMLWFDTSYDVAAIGPGAGINYGVEDLGKVGPDAATYSPDIVGGNANFQTIPEPATAILAMIGGGLAYFVRRANRSHVKD
jgi:hypothetical protein